jgi:UDP-glucose 4-epimerase
LETPAFPRRGFYFGEKRHPGATVVERAFSDQGVEAVIHAGALHKPDIVRVSAQAFVEVNVTGTLNLLQAAVTAGHHRFVFTSTTSLMISQTIQQGASSAAVWLDEGGTGA